MELCQWYNVEEEEFVDMWIAFGVQLDGNLEPTLESLDEMKRKVPRSKNNSQKSVKSINLECRSKNWSGLEKYPLIKIKLVL